MIVRGVPRIIGLAGPAGVGKSQVAEAMDEVWRYERGSFATLLKEICTKAFGVNTQPLAEAKALLSAGGDLTPAEIYRCNRIRARIMEIGTAFAELGEKILGRGAEDPVVR